MSIINLETTTWKATHSLFQLDKTFIGTEDYMGVCYFWDYEYRHSMRPTTAKQRKTIHHALIKAGLDVGGKSDSHAQIIRKHCLKWDKNA